MSFTDAQRTSIGVCVAQLEELVDALRRLGVHDERVDRVSATAARLATATQARKPAGPKNAVRAALTQMRVLEEELRPSRLSAYGELSAASAELVDGYVDELAALTTSLLEEL